MCLVYMAADFEIQSVFYKSFNYWRIIRLAPVLKTSFHQCVISYTCSQSNSDDSVLKQSHQSKTGYKYMIGHINEKLQNRAIRARLAKSLWSDTLMKKCFKDWSQSNLSRIIVFICHFVESRTELSSTLFGLCVLIPWESKVWYSLCIICQQIIHKL